VKVESAEFVPHSNQAVVARPFGVTFALRVAPVAATEVAARVATVGSAPGEEVVKFAIALFVVPFAFTPQTSWVYGRTRTFP